MKLSDWNVENELIGFRLLVAVLVIGLMCGIGECSTYKAELRVIKEGCSKKES